MSLNDPKLFTQTADNYIVEATMRLAVLAISSVFVTGCASRALSEPTVERTAAELTRCDFQAGESWAGTTGVVSAYGSGLCAARFVDDRIIAGADFDSMFFDAPAIEGDWQLQDIDANIVADHAGHLCATWSGQYRYHVKDGAAKIGLSLTCTDAASYFSSARVAHVFGIAADIQIVANRS